ncbi:MAG: glycosyl hydrolase [Haliea sp.]|jgi:photosystem II stability/assembly factor-like uncharacterized protein|nr:glycosyl hydrolase [Haliea sp.]
MRRSALLTQLLTFLMLAGVAGCEAPLELERVQAQLQQSTQRSDLLQDVAASGEALVAVGNMGTVLTSADRGQSWQRQTLEGKPFLMAVTTCPDDSFVALDYARKLWFSDTEGMRWESRPIDTVETVQAMACDPAGKLWVVGSFSTILSSDDGGNTWSETSLNEDLLFTTIRFLDENTAYLLGEFGTVVRTTDGGATWENLEYLPDEFYPQDAHFDNDQVGWVVGLTGTVLVTTDGGNSWRRQDSGTAAPLYGITRNGGKLYVVGGNGTVLQSSVQEGHSGDNRWTAVEHGKPIRFYLRGAVPVADGELLVGGGAGALYVIDTGA